MPLVLPKPLQGSYLEETTKPQQITPPSLPGAGLATPAPMQQPQPQQPDLDSWESPQMASQGLSTVTGAPYGNGPMTTAMPSLPEPTSMFNQTPRPDTSYTSEVEKFLDSVNSPDLKSEMWNRYSRTFASSGQQAAEAEWGKMYQAYKFIPTLRKNAEKGYQRGRQPSDAELLKIGMAYVDKGATPDGHWDNAREEQGQDASLETTVLQGLALPPIGGIIGGALSKVPGVGGAASALTKGAAGFGEKPLMNIASNIAGELGSRAGMEAASKYTDSPILQTAAALGGGMLAGGLTARSISKMPGQADVPMAAMRGYEDEPLDPAVEELLGIRKSNVGEGVPTSVTEILAKDGELTLPDADAVFKVNPDGTVTAYSSSSGREYTQYDSIHSAGNSAEARRFEANTRAKMETLNEALDTRLEFEGPTTFRDDPVDVRNELETTGKYSDGSYVLVKNEDGSVSRYLDDGGGRYSYETEVYSNVEEALTRTGVYSPNEGWRSIDTEILNNKYASYSEDALQREINTANEAMGRIEQQGFENGWDDARIDAQHEHLRQEQRKAQAWLDLKTGKNTPGAQSLMRAVRNQRLQQGYNPMAGGSLFSDAPALRPLQDIMGEVALAKDGLLGLGSRVLGNIGINPSLMRRTVAGVAATASARQAVEAEGFRDYLVKSAWDGTALRSARGDRVFKVSKDGVLKVQNLSGVEENVSWHRVFERPQDYKLTHQQQVAVYRFLDVVDAVETRRELTGLPSRRAKLPPNTFFVPREATKLLQNVQGQDEVLELQRRSRHGLQREYSDVQEAFDKGVRYADPRTTLSNYIDEAYGEMRRFEFDHFLSRWAVKPTELIPEGVQVEWEKTRREFLSAGKLAQKEGKMARRYYEKLLTDDVETARKQWEAARRNLTRIEGELTGRAQLAAGRRQTPITVGTRLAEAKALVTITERIHKDASEAFNKRPIGSAGERRMGNAGFGKAQERIRSIEQTLKDTRDNLKSQGVKPADYKNDATYSKALDIWRKEREAYASALTQEGQAQALVKGQAKTLLSKATTNELLLKKAAYEKATKARNRALESYQNVTNAVGPMALFDENVVKARGAMQDAERELAATRLNARKAGVSYHVDPNVQNAQATALATKKAYDVELKAARAKYIDSETGNVNKISIADWKKKFIKIEFQEDLEKAVAHMQDTSHGFWTNITQEVADIRRIPTTGLDMGAPLIHGLPLLTRNPVAWSRATWRQYRGFWNPTNQGTFIENHMDTIRKMTEHELTPGGSDFFNALEPNPNKPIAQAVGNAVSKLPGGDTARSVARQATAQTFGRFAAGYEFFLLSARTDLWESMAPHWKGTESELAQHIRNMTGGLDSRSLGVQARQRAFESAWVALSPKLLRSVVSLGVDALDLSDIRGGNFNPFAMTKGGQARRALTQLTSGVTTLYIATGLAKGELSGEDPEKTWEGIKDGLNPLSGKRFLSHKIGNQWIGVGGTIRSTLQLLAGIYASAAPAQLPGGDKPIGDLWAASGRSNPLINFLVSRGAPAAGISAAIGEHVTGANLTGFEQVDGLADLGATLATDNAPFTVAGMIEGDSILGSATGFGGLRTSPETPIEQRVESIEEEILPLLKGEGILPPEVDSIDDLGFGEQDAVDRYLKNSRPDLQEAYEAYRREFGSIYQRQADRRAEIDAEYKPTFDRLYSDLVTGRQDARSVLDQLSTTRSLLRGQLAELYNAEDFKKGIAQLDQNNMQKVASDYFDIYDQVAKGDKVLTTEQWEEVSRLQEEFVAGLPANVGDRFRNDLALRDSVIDAHPIIKLKREVDNASESYNQLADENKESYLRENPELDVMRAVVYGSDLHSVTAVDALLNKQVSSGEVGKIVKDAQFSQEIKLSGFKHRIDTDRKNWEIDKGDLEWYMSLPSDKRSKLSEQVPGANAMLVFWGATDRIYDSRGLIALDSYMDGMNWSTWNSIAPDIGFYLRLPGTQKDGRDKKHIGFIDPMLDASVAQWQEFMYGIEPEFHSLEGRTEFYRRTGRNVSQYKIIAPED